MEFLKNCATGIQTLSGYTTIVYHIYYVPRTSITSEGPRLCGSCHETPDDLLDLEGHLRDRKYIVHADITKDILWVFEANGEGDFVRGAPDISMLELDGHIEFQKLFQGTANAAELAAYGPPGSLEPRDGLSSGNPSQLAARISSHDAAPPNELQVPGVSAVPEISDIRSIHANFISAVTSAIAFRLADQSSIVSLGLDRIVMPSPQKPISRLRHACAPATILRITVYLTSTGHLIISTAPAHTPALFCVSDLRAVASLQPNTPMLLAPTSSAAQYAGNKHGATSMLNFHSQAYVYWRDRLVKGLGRMGIHVSNPEDEASWVAVNIPWPISNPQANDSISSTIVSVWWPAPLCFVERTGLEEMEASLPPANTSAWFLDPAKGGFLDPVTAAEQWFRGHAERDQKIASRRQRKREQAMTQKQLMASSPISSRNITYGETHGAGGVYPTPPDGLASHHTVGINPMDASASAFPDGHFFGNNHVAEAKDAMSMELDISSPFENRQIDEKPPVTNDLTTGLEDDLFGDMDEDDFGGNDITDADFSFFDQPDGPDVDMQDKSDIDASLSGPNEDYKSSNVDVTIEDMKSPEPLVGKQSLENAHQSGSQAEVDAPKDPSDILPVPIPEELNTDHSGTNQVERLDPLEVKKRLFADGTDATLAFSGAVATTQGIFRPLLFSHDLSMVDAKYSSSGQFGVVSQSIPSKRALSGGNAGTISLPSPMKTPNRKVTPVRIKDPLALPRSIDDRESDRSNWASDSDSISDETESGYIQSPVKETPMGKQITRLEMPPSPSNSIEQQELDTMTRTEMMQLLQSVLLPRPRGCLSNLSAVQQPLGQLKVSAIGLESKEQNFIEEYELKTFDRDFINIAQIITEQIAFATLDFLPNTSTLSGVGQTLITNDHYTKRRQALSVIAFQRAAKSSLGLNTLCNLIKYASIPDLIPDQSNLQKPQPRTGQPKPPTPSTRSEVNISGHPIRLPVPHIRVRRNDNLWDLLSPAVPFWETLGLAPAGGAKNVVSYTIYPLNDDLKSYASRFVNDLGISYEILKLGTHSRGALGPDVGSDLIPWNLPQSFTPDGVEISLRHTCVELGKALAAVDRERYMKSPQGGPAETIVIYMINPFDGFPIFSTIASGFWTLFNTYRKSVSPSFQSRQADLVLQIIPISFVANSDRIVVSQNPYIHTLAREVYNRCPPSSQNADPAGLSIYPATSIQLSEALPRKISFELTVDPPSNIMHDNSQLHVGYARSKSSNWITAAYTDNAGRYQAVVSYCLSGSRTFSEVAEEIWQTSLEIMQARRVNWRLCISKAGLMENEELDAWTALAAPQQPIPIITVLVSVDLSPPLSLLPPMTPPMSPPVTGPTKPAAQTPIGTPTQLGMSPDPHSMTPAATPSESTAMEAGNDPDAHLVDTTDETLCIVLGHRLNLHPTPSEYHQTLSSGLLVKIPPPTPTTNPFCPSEIPDPYIVECIMVHLLWARNSVKAVDAGAGIWGSPSAAPKTTTDGILREYLGLYRNLGLLAKVRGMTGSRAGLVPWQILSAVKGVEGLDAVFGTERW